MLVEEIMTTELKTVSPRDTLSDIYDIFNQVPYHHLPVVNEGKIVGIISDRDVSQNTSPLYGTDEERLEDKALMEKTAAMIMTADVITIDNTTSIDTASILLLENNISCLSIADDDDVLIGLLTWKDILNFYVYAS